MFLVLIFWFLVKPLQYSTYIDNHLYFSQLHFTAIHFDSAFADFFPALLHSDNIF